jgi:hypothetical protein
MARSDYGKLFKDVISRSVGANQYGPSFKTIASGSLVTFQYMFAKNDVYPLVILTYVSANYLHGVNLHYLTFNEIKQVLQKDKLNGCRPGFNYQNVKPYQYIVKAYRTYKRNGIKGLKVLDCDLIVKSMTVTRSIDPQEAEAIRENVRNQIAGLVNTTVENMMEK